MAAPWRWVWPRGTGLDEGTEPDPQVHVRERADLPRLESHRARARCRRARIVQLLPPFPGVPIGRHLLGVPLIVLGAVLAVVAYGEWMRNQRALRHGQPLPRSVLPWLLAANITAMAVISAVVLILSAAR